jgi:DNA-binding response OmpR family regulator
MDKRVLVVDDDEPTRQMVSAVLKRSGFVADVCENGREGLDRLASTDYGAIVLSLVRRDPRGDADLLRELKSGSQTALDEMASDLIAARLRKPFQIDELVSAVGGCFEEAAPQQ